MRVEDLAKALWVLDNDSAKRHWTVEKIQGGYILMSDHTRFTVKELANKYDDKHETDSIIPGFN
jgi:hypothetical protein